MPHIRNPNRSCLRHRHCSWEEWVGVVVEAVVGVLVVQLVVVAQLVVVVSGVGEKQLVVIREFRWVVTRVVQ